MKTKTTLLFTAAATAMLLSFPNAADAQLGQLINIDVNGDGADTMTGAAVLGAAGDLWNGVGNANNFNPVALTGLSLVDSTNTLTNVTFDLTSGFIFAAGGSGTPFSGTPYQSLFEDFTGVSDANVGTVTLHGLTPGLYDLVIYAVGDTNPNNGAQGRVANYTANGLSGTIGPNNGSSALNEDTNYVRFTPLVGLDGLLNITFADAEGGASNEADINGLQLQAVPEPSALLMLGSGAGMFGLLRRRRS